MKRVYHVYTDTEWRVYQREIRGVVWPTESTNPEEEVVADES